MRKARYRTDIAAMISIAAFTQAKKNFLLNNYLPKSIYRIPVTIPEKAKYPVIDIHSHAYAQTTEELATWVAMMDEVGVEKTIIQSFATGPEFDSIYQVYSKYKKIQTACLL